MAFKQMLVLLEENMVGPNEIKSTSSGTQFQLCRQRFGKNLGWELKQGANLVLELITKLSLKPDLDQNHQ